MEQALTMIDRRMGAVSGLRERVARLETGPMFSQTTTI